MLIIFFIICYISGISKATNCLKVVNGDDGNLRAELPSWSRPSS